MSPWVRLSDSYRDDRRLALVSTDAEALFLRLLAASNRTLADGWLHAVQVHQEAASRLLDANRIDAAINALVTVGLLERKTTADGDGFRIAADYVANQPSREKVEKDRAHWRAENARRLQKLAKRRAKVALRMVDGNR